MPVADRQRSDILVGTVVGDLHRVSAQPADVAAGRAGLGDRQVVTDMVDVDRIAELVRQGVAIAVAGVHLVKGYSHAVLHRPIRRFEGIGNADGEGFGLPGAKFDQIPRAAGFAVALTAPPGA